MTEHAATWAKRISSLPDAQMCRAAPTEQFKRVRSSGKPAALGSAGHKIVELLIAEPDKRPDLQKIGFRYGLSAAEIEWMEDRMAFIADLPEDWTIYVEHEVTLHAGRHRILGHLDLAIVNPEGDIADIYDWKFGFEDALPVEMNPQAIGYASAFIRDHPTIKAVRPHIYYPRLMKVDVLDDDGFWGRRFLAEMAEEIGSICDEVETPNPEYRPGLGCRYCSARAYCSALHGAVPALITGAKGHPVSFKDLTPAQKAKAVPIRKAIGAMLDEFDAQAKIWIDEQPDHSFDLGNGKVYRRIDGSKKDPVVRKIWPWLEPLLGTRLPEAIEIGLGKLAEIAVEVNVPLVDGKRKGKGKFLKEMWEKLLADGAFEEVPTKQYKITNKPKEEE